MGSSEASTLSTRAKEKKRGGERRGQTLRSTISILEGGGKNPFLFSYLGRISFFQGGELFFPSIDFPSPPLLEEEKRGFFHQ